MTITLHVNQQSRSLGEIDPSTPLLWALRDHLGLLGTKYGCGVAQCGACTVHINGNPMRACQLPIAAVVGANITTIEGLASTDGSLSALQQAWVDLDVPQCGYCQAGQLMSATALLERNPNPSDEEINAAMSGVICRCGTYNRIVKAIKTVAEQSTINHFDPTAGGDHETV